MRNLPYPTLLLPLPTLLPYPTLPYPPTYPTLPLHLTPSHSFISTRTLVIIVGSWRHFLHLKACFFCCFSTLRFLCNIVVHYRSLNIVSFLVQRGYFGFMPTLSAPKSLLFFFFCIFFFFVCFVVVVVAMDSW